ATDIDNAGLTYSIVAGPSASQGTVALTNASTGAYSFIPAPNFNGAANFTFKASDGALDSNIATISITVAPVNDLPVAANGTLSTPRDIAANGTLAATDVESSNLTYSIVAGPSASQGTVVLTNAATGAYRFTPAPNFTGQTSFTFKANDGTADTNVATISISVTGVNFPAVANDAALTTAEDTPATGTLTAVDVDRDPLTYSIVTGPDANQGTVAIT